MSEIVYNARCESAIFNRFIIFIFYFLFFIFYFLFFIFYFLFFIFYFLFFIFYFLFALKEDYLGNLKMESSFEFIMINEGYPNDIITNKRGT